MDLFDKCVESPLGRQLREAGFEAYYRVLQSAPDGEVVVEGRKAIMLGSNNYLGLATHPRVKRAAAEAIEQWGAGTTGSRTLNGTLEIHEDLERRLARFFRRDAALFYTSGYMANLGTISALAGRGDVIVADRLAHGSVLDGARLSLAELKRFKHNDTEDLKRVLEGCGDAGKLVVVDGVYSMDGDIAPLGRIVQACRAHGARLLVDDAHGLGVLGRDGRGTPEHFGVEDQVDVIVGTTSKSLPSVGGFAVADLRVIDYLRRGRTCRPMIFAASPPPSAVAAVREALLVLQQEPGLRRTLWSHTRRMHKALRGMGFDTGNSQTPIIPVVAGSVERTFQAWRMLTDEGIFVNVAIPPAVPSGRCAIRMTITAAQTEAQLDRVIDALERIGKQLGIIPGGDRAGEPVARKAG